MCGSGQGEEEVDSSKAEQSVYLYQRGSRREAKGRDVQHVLRGDDETPSSPYCAGCDESEVLRQGELFGGTREVGNTCDDEGPLLHQISE